MEDKSGIGIEMIFGKGKKPEMPGAEIEIEKESEDYGDIVPKLENIRDLIKSGDKEGALAAIEDCIAENKGDGDDSLKEDDSMGSMIKEVMSKK